MHNDKTAAVLCRKCGLPLRPKAIAFGSTATGWEHPSGCPKVWPTRPMRTEFATDADYLTALAGYGQAEGYAAVYIDTEVVARLADFGRPSEKPHDEVWGTNG